MGPSRDVSFSSCRVVSLLRAGAQHRRSSVSDRSSASPERGDAPMLPRRTQAGPPSFKPVPPPSEEPREKGAVKKHIMVM